MIALGWCLADQSLPAPLKRAGSGRVIVITVAANLGATARDRLCLLQRTFDAGVDLVPLAPARSWPVASAEEIATHGADDLLDQLSQIRGRGQLTLRADWPGMPSAPVTGLTGRDWMQRLRDQQALSATRAELAQTVLTTLCVGLPAPRPVFRSEGTGFALHLLLARENLPEGLQRIAKAAAALTLTDGGAVTVSGLWPAFDFVRSPLCLEQVSP